MILAHRKPPDLSDHQLNIVRDYWNDPNQSLKKLEEKHKTKQSDISRLLTKVFRLNKEDRDKLINQTKKNNNGQKIH
ncbi:MAG: hypothetical protein J7577_13430 [Sphingobacteriaceae bacterium]|nr:hypothetical protein [Sphingobacteriaceae bacterium]